MFVKLFDGVLWRVSWCSCVGRAAYAARAESHVVHGREAKIQPRDAACLPLPRRGGEVVIYWRRAGSVVVGVEERIGDDLASVDGADEDEEGAAGDYETEGAGGFVALVVYTGHRMISTRGRAAKLGEMVGGEAAWLADAVCRARVRSVSLEAESWAYAGVRTSNSLLHVVEDQVHQRIVALERAGNYIETDQLGVAPSGTVKPFQLYKIMQSGEKGAMAIEGTRRTTPAHTAELKLGLRL